MSDEVLHHIVCSPRNGLRPLGRPQTHYILSQGEEFVARTCTKCGGIGHNRQDIRMLEFMMQVKEVCQIGILNVYDV